MSATLVARGLAVAHGDQSLFADLDLVVAPGDVIGLVGANGAGKSTLLRVLAGLTASDAGTVTLSPHEATIGYLPQEPARRAAGDRAAVPGPAHRGPGGRRGNAGRRPRPGRGRRRGRRRLRAGAGPWLALGGADLDERAEAVTAGLGLRVDLDHEMTALSGGQTARAGLASLLLSRYDVFLLDEPTNDLDLDGLARLESFVGGLRAGTVLVSHDREFLTRTVTQVVELDLAQRQVRVLRRWLCRLPG